MDYSELFNDKIMVHKAPLECYIHDLSISKTEFYNLSGKSILLIGGGKSPIKKGLADNGIINCVVANIEPYLAQASYDIQDVLFRKSLFDFDYWNHLDKFDEIWLRFSLPRFANTDAQKLLSFFIPLLMLKERGFLRILPVSDRWLAALKDLERIGASHSIKQIQSMNPVAFEKKFIDMLSADDLPKPPPLKLDDIFDGNIPKVYFDNRNVDNLVTLQKTKRFDKWQFQSLIIALQTKSA